MSNTITSPTAGEFIIGQHRKLNLETLAVEINREHHEVGRTLKVGFAHAVRAGELLVQAKLHCEHGGWLEWLENNFDGSARTAQAYMQVAKRRVDIETKAQHIAHLSFQEALRLTATPKVDEDFFASIPEPSPDFILRGVEEVDRGVLVELHPSPFHAGYYHLLVYRGLDSSGEPCVDYDRRGCRYDRKLLSFALENIHQTKPMFWDAIPATEKLPWPAEADKRIDASTVQKKGGMDDTH